MKKKILRMLMMITLMAAVSIQSVSFPDNTPVIEAAKQADPLDTTDGFSDVSWPKGPNKKSLSSSSAVLMDADTGLVLYNKNMNDVHYPASITKIMTTLLCIENCNLNDTVTFTVDEVTGLEWGASNIGTQIGETLTIDQCLYGIMLSSANEVCLGVADHIAGSIPAFADMMNERAKVLGCKHTHFSNPNGLHSDDHYTTAYDMALIGREALKSPTFRKVTGTKVAYLDKTNKYDKRTLTNHHNMLNPYSSSRFLYEDCIGGKTGYTSVAMNTLVTFAERDGMTLVCVVMHGGSSKSYPDFNIYTDTKALLDYGFDNYKVHEINSTQNVGDEVDSPLFTLFDSIFDKDNAPLQTSSTGQLLLPNGVEKDSAIQNITFYADHNDETHEIGNVTYTYGNKTVGSTNIYFHPDACSNTLATSEDIIYSDSKRIAAKKSALPVLKTKVKFPLRNVLIITAVIVIVIAIIFYINLLIQRKKLSDRRYRHTNRRQK